MVPEPASPAADMLARVRSVLAQVDLDCTCRAKLDGAFERFADLEHKRERRRLIVHAREQALRIAGLLDFMRELDDIATSEADLGVFTEIACLFADVAEAAQAGQRDMRQAARPA
jgi:hypothetical protein